MSQTTIPFPVRKRCSFYGRKEDVAKEDFANATARHTPSKYTPTVKKVVTLTSSESESDSDIENTTEERRRMNDDRRTDSWPRSRHRKCNDLDEQHSLSPPKQRRNESQGRNNFYDRKEDVAKKEFENATARHTPSKNTQIAKKVVTLTSSESDSDIENTTEERRRMNDDRRTDSWPRSRHRKCNDLGEQHSLSPPKQRRNESQGRNNFYDRKEDVAKKEFENATARHIPSKNTQIAKKVVTLTSSESDSDIENTTEERRRMNDDRRTDSSPRSRHRKCNDLGEQHSLSPPKQRRNESQGRNNFYDRKEDVAKKEFENATARHTPSKNTRTAKKVVTLTSSESDSDIENTTEERRRMNDDRRTDSSPRSRHRKCNYLDEQHSVSPPKQRRNESQGRNKSPLTPSTLLGKLDLSVTKKGKLDPKQLFKSHLSKEEEEDELNSNLLFGSNKYQNARKALHSSATEELPGREEELAKLQKFFQRHLEGGTSGSLYVSGPPGTGKTATLFKMMRQSDLRSKVKIVYINCTSMKSAAAIYAKIIQATIGATKSGKNSKAVIERYLTSKSRTLLLVLDEIDQLESKKQSVLYSIFEWPSLPNSNLILVGIANALDLTDRMLPRLQARCELKPMLMHFAPYTKQQIFDIISARLNQANANGIFTPSAIQLLAGKVAAISGDIRRALDISRRVVELAESHQVAQVLRPTNDNDTNIESLKHETEITEKPVDLKEVVTILNGVYGGTQNIDQEQDSFPLQQKLLLCSLLLILNKGRNKDVTVGKLHEVYKKVCKKRNIFAVDVSEFVNLCSLIETRGILRVVGRKEARLCKVNLQWDLEELDAALQDKQMMADIINDTSCL